MKRSQLIATIAFAAFVPLVGNVASADTAATQQITASVGAFTPSQITVHVNQPVTLDLTSAAGVHGLQSSALGIPQTLIEPGTTSTVTFTPTKVGTYLVHCSVPCGPGHANMVLTINVVP